jgi:hypothetical protein
LMATSFGVKCLEPANPSHYERLKRHALPAHKREGAAGEGRDGGAHLPLRMPPPLRSARPKPVRFYTLLCLPYGLPMDTLTPSGHTMPTRRSS